MGCFSNKSDQKPFLKFRLLHDQDPCCSAVVFQLLLMVVVLFANFVGTVI